MNGSDTPRLAGARILIVEDEFFLANDLDECLRNAGAEVIGPVGSYEAAERLINETDPSCAILDMNLRGVPSTGLADLLDRRNIGYLVVSGYDPEAFPDRLRDTPRLTKPVSPSEILNAVQNLVTEKAG